MSGWWTILSGVSETGNGGIESTFVYIVLSWLIIQWLSSIICKTEVIKKFKYNIKFIKSQDYKLWLDMIISGIKIYSCDRAVIMYFNNPINKIKIKKQLFFSIKARIDYLNLYRPLLSLILLIGYIKDKIKIYKLNFFNKNEIWCMVYLLLFWKTI